MKSTEISGKPRLAVLLTLACILTNPVTSRAATFVTTGFNQVTGNMFYDQRGNLFQTASLASVTITPNPSLLNTAFAGFFTPETGPAVPGDRNGGASTKDIPLILNFSEPVASFGATFVHLLDRTGFDNPVTLEVFSGPYGTGTLLGSVTDSLGSATTRQASANFVGIWSDSLNICSAVIASSSPTGGFGIDGYAISLTTAIPEPGTLSLWALGLLALGKRLRSMGCWRSAAQ